MPGPKRREWRAKKIGKQAGAKAPRTRQEKSTPPKIVLEIGPGGSPVLGYYKKSRRKILLDIEPCYSKESKKILKKRHPNVEAVTGDVMSLPLQNNSISRIECRIPSFTGGTSAGIVRAANEMRRVLTPNGEVSMTIVDSCPSSRLDKTIDIFEKAGFSVKTLTPLRSNPSLSRRETYSERLSDKPPFAEVIYIKFKKKPNSK